MSIFVFAAYLLSTCDVGTVMMATIIIIVAIVPPLIDSIMFVCAVTEKKKGPLCRAWAFANQYFVTKLPPEENP